MQRNPATKLSFPVVLGEFFSRNSSEGIAQAIVDSMSFGFVCDTALRIRRNTRAAGVYAVSPFLDPILEPFLLNDVEERFFRPVTKLPARKAIEKVLDERVAWRKDDQGLRWSPKKYIRANRDELSSLLAAGGKHVPEKRGKIDANFLNRLSVLAFFQAVERCTVC